MSVKCDTIYARTCAELCTKNKMRYFEIYILKLFLIFIKSKVTRYAILFLNICNNNDKLFCFMLKNGHDAIIAI